MIKVLIVNTVTTRNNGITNAIFNLLGNINDSEFVFDYLSINKVDDFYSEQISYHKGTVFLIDRRKRYLFFLFRFYQILKKNKYDIVYFHANSRVIGLDLLICRAAGIKHRIVHSHSTQTKHKLLNRLMSPLFFLNCNHRIACGIKAGQWMFKNKPFKIINNGIDVDKFAFSNIKRSKTRKAMNISDDALVLGHVGAFDNNKNQIFIVNLIAQLKLIDINAFLVLIGDGPNKKSLEKYCLENGLNNNVLFLGTINDVDNYLSAFDLFVMPSKYEGFPLTLVEAQANGLKILASNTISHEVDISNSITFLDFSDNWVKEIIKNRNYNRKTKCEKNIKFIRKRKYDSCSQSKELVAYFRNIL